MRNATRQYLTVGGIRLDVTGISARNRRRLILGVSGGAGDDLEALDVLLERVTAENLAELSDEDVATLRADLEGRKESTKAGIGDLPASAAEWSDADLETARGIQAAVARIDTALETVSGDETRRDEAATQRATDAQALLDAIRGEDGGDPEPTPDPEAEPEATPEVEPEATPEAEPEAEPEPAEAAEPEKIAAAAARPPRRVEARGSATTPTPRKPAAVNDNLVLRASANVPGVPAGMILDTPAKIGNAFERALRATAGYVGPRVEVPVMQLGAFDAAEVYGEDRTLRDDYRANAAKIDRHSSLEAMRDNAKGSSDPALRASQGFCAPIPNNYDQPVLGSTARPVRDEMTHRYGADRGGVRTLPAPRLAGVTGATTVWTAANDVALNSPATKACATLTCPDPDETLIDAIVTCLKIGNFRKMSFQENIDAWVRLAAVHAVRTAETKMLTKIGAESIQVTVAATGNELGTTRNVLATIDRITAQARSFNRMDPEYPFRLGFPSWLQDNMITDLSREVPGATAERLATSDAEINGFLRAKGVNVTWFLDGETGQVYSAQADGALQGWKSHVIGYLYPEGQWLGLDGGSLDFGIVRDSILNSTNDFQMMSEFFENAHQVFVADSFRLDIDICPNGKTSLPVAIDPCTAGS